MLLDPMYTFYRYPDQYALYLKLKQGDVSNPHRVLLDVFKTRYGYTAHQTWIARVIRTYPDYFRVLHSDDMGMIFEALDKPALTQDEILARSKGIVLDKKEDAQKTNKQSKKSSKKRAQKK